LVGWVSIALVFFDLVEQFRARPQPIRPGTGWVAEGPDGLAQALPTLTVSRVKTPDMMAAQ
jgi:hypothetical protein